MTRTIRVKQQNKEAIMAAMIEAGFTATPCEAPLSSLEYEMNVFSSYEEWSEDSKVGMTGIETSASGKQAHKIISALRAEGTII